jgi:hypothetical protein
MHYYAAPSKLMFSIVMATPAFNALCNVREYQLNLHNSQTAGRRLSVKCGKKEP